MHDLLMITADADAEAVMKVVINRCDSLRIRAVDAHIERHDGRDSGVFLHAPEMTRGKKGEFRHLLLLWDHDSDGSRLPVGGAETDVVKRLAGITWKDRCAAVAIEPEIEEWFWHSPDAVRGWLKISDETSFRRFQEEIAARHHRSLEDMCRHYPKELMLGLSKAILRRGKWRPDDWGGIAKRASLPKWEQSVSFRKVAETLRRWFPA